MSERDVPSWSGGSAVGAEVSERIRSILVDSEAAAAAIRHQAEQDAQAGLRAAETEALKIVEDARREAERFLADRIKRVSDMSDELLERGQDVVERLDAADEVRARLADLVVALGDTAARLANEVRSMPGPRVEGIESPPTRRRSATPGSPGQPDEQGAGASAAAPAAPADADEPGVEEELRPPTPLRPGAPSERASVEPGAEPEAPVDEAPVDEAPVEEAVPSPDEVELLEQVRAAEREREGREAADVTSSGADPDGLVSEQADTVPTHAPEAPVGKLADEALGARLVALQMAVAGGSRGEVETHLRRTFDLDEPTAILDDIFGPGTEPEQRVVWPEAG